ncbi:MAG: hypothetical protein AABZ64_16435 [Nitrospinota bacterium]
MPRSYFWILYLHILGACLYVGAVAFFAILLQSLRRRLPPEEFAGETAAIVRFYHPFILVCMGVLILTGAWYLTGLKAAMGPGFGAIFVPLGLKLGTVFLMVLGMSFQFFALGLRLTRGTGPAGNGRPPAAGTEERLALIGAIERTNLVNLLLGLLAIFFGLALNKGF